jgi:hypothetical protein
MVSLSPLQVVTLNQLTPCRHSIQIGLDQCVNLRRRVYALVERCWPWRLNDIVYLQTRSIYANNPIATFMVEVARDCKN